MNKNSIFSAFIIASFFFASCATSPNLNSKKIIEFNASAEWKDILKAPPKEGSIFEKNEINEVIKAQGDKSGPLWEQAILDAEANIFKSFSSVLGSDFNSHNYPEIENLIKHGNQIARPLVLGAKGAYSRKRPFQIDDKISLCPNASAFGSSFPSGHAAHGWYYGIILSKIFPQKQNEIMKRAKVFGDNRVICGAHFPSDVEAGRIVGEIIIKKLETDEQFTKMLYFAQEKAKLKL